MCGLAGIWRLSGRIDEVDISEARQMSAALVQRGPDGAGDWNDRRLMLHHRRLSIIDHSKNGLQPMITADGKGVIAYNGEVYNFASLRNELEAEGVRFFSKTDTEVVLNALHVWGVNHAVLRFNGMFAFAYYDLRTSELWLARDRAGIKSISTLQTGGRLLFASEDKGILGAQSVTANISNRSISLFLANQCINSRLSMFNNIERLPPGGLWRVGQSEISKAKFWDAVDAIDIQRLASKPGRSEDQIESLDSLIQGSVAGHLVSDAPLATTCSSGVDSGLITSIAARSNQTTHAYVVAPDEGISEYAGARKTAHSTGIELRPVQISKEDYLRTLPKTVFDLESGISSYSAVAKSIMIRRCKSDGIKVLLTGEGADEVLGGYPWYRISARKHRFTDHPLAKLFFPKWNARRHDRLINAPFSNSIGVGNLNVRGTVAAALWPENSLQQKRIMEALAPIPTSFDRVYAGGGIFDFYFHMQDIVHRHDRIAMAESVEIRVPFLENSLIDFGLSLPPSLKYRRGHAKWLLKRVAENYLPRENIYAKKRGFPVSPSYMSGTEKILSRGFLANALGWSKEENRYIIELLRGRPDLLIRAVSMELLIRIYEQNQTTEELGEQLVALSSE